MNKFQKVIQKMLGIEPTEVNGLNNLSSIYHLTQLRQKLFARFDITGMPDWWDRGYFFQLLFLEPGYLAITYDAKIGKCFYQCGYTGNNRFYQPTRINVANIIDGSFDRTLGVDAALVRMDQYFQSYQPLLNYYAYRLAACDSGIDVNLMNSKTCNIYRVSSINEKKNVEEMVRKVNLGKPAVYVVDSKMTIEPYTVPVKNNYVADLIQDTKRTIMEEFLTEIGVNNANIRKKERLVTSEVDSNNEEIHLNVGEVLRMVQEGLDKANELFNMDLTIKLKEYQNERDDTEGSSTMVSGNVSEYSTAG